MYLVVWLFPYANISIVRVAAPLSVPVHTQSLVACGRRSEKKENERQGVVLFRRSIGSHSVLDDHCAEPPQKKGIYSFGESNHAGVATRLFSCFPTLFSFFFLREKKEPRRRKKSGGKHNYPSRQRSRKIKKKRVFAAAASACVGFAARA